MYLLINSELPDSKYKDILHAPNLTARLFYTRLGLIPDIGD